MPTLPDAGEGFHSEESVGIGRGFVGAVTLHAGKTEGEAAGVAGADLQVIEGDLHHQFRFDVDGVLIARDFDFQELFRLPGEDFVGEAFEGFAEHGEAAFLGVPGAQVEIAEPAAAAATAPFGGEHHQVKRADTLDLEPTPAARAGGVASGYGLGHDALMAAVERAAEEIGGAAGVGGESMRDEDFGRGEFGEQGETACLGLIQ